MALDVVCKVDGGEVAARGALHHVFGLLEHLGLRGLDAPFGDHDGRGPDRAEEGERERGPAEADVGVADVDLDGVHAHLVDEGGDGASVGESVSICMYVWGICMYVGATERHTR